MLITGREGRTFLRSDLYSCMITVEIQRRFFCLMIRHIKRISNFQLL